MVLLELREPGSLRVIAVPSLLWCLTSAQVQLEAFCCDVEILVDKPHIPTTDLWLADPKHPVSFPRKELHAVWSSW